MFESLVPRLQPPGLRFATNLMHCQSAILCFLVLNHLHCHVVPGLEEYGQCLVSFEAHHKIIRYVKLVSYVCTCSV